MIKLLDDPKIIEKLCIAEPYAGCIFMATATAFYDTPELMTIWVELDEHGKAVSAVNVGSSHFQLLCGKSTPSAEMLMFLTKLAEDEHIKEILCGECAFPILSGIFGTDVSVLPLMKCSKHIKYEPKEPIQVTLGNTNGLCSLVYSQLDEDEKPDRDMWMLKITRGIARGQSTVLTVEQDGKALSGACIRGRCKAGGAIVSVITDEACRNRGFASLLTARCAEILKSEGLCTWLCPCDERAERLYSRLGFRRCGSLYTININKKENIK